MIRYFSLDIVRGLAALSVLLTHWGGWTLIFADNLTASIISFYNNFFNYFLWAGGGAHPGVIIFIVLSGFCIHLPQALDSSRILMPNFWRSFSIRRFIRIMPTYWTALLLGIICFYLVGPVDSNINSQNITFSLFFSFFGISEFVRFFNINSLYPGNPPLATVAAEILLYATYPLYLSIYKKYGPLILLFFGFINYSIVILARLFSIDPTYLAGTYFEFSMYWIIGFLSATLFSKAVKSTTIFPKNYLLAVFIASYLIYFIVISVIKVKGFHVLSTLLLASITGIALVTILSFEEFFSKKYSSNILRITSALGARSYSLYVVHTPVIFISLLFLDYYKNINNYLYPLLVLLIVFIFTEILFRTVERPSYKIARFFSV